MDPILKQISNVGIVPVIAIDDAEKAVPLAKALVAGGLPVAEVTFRTDAAEEAIRRIKVEVPDVCVCAGTVLNVKTAERAVKAGINEVVFDRGGYIYTGRVAELAAGAREGGLNF